MRRNPYSTGYVAAKIRENTARRNGAALNRYLLSLEDNRGGISFILLEGASVEDAARRAGIEQNRIVDHELIPRGKFVFTQTGGEPFQNLQIAGSEEEARQMFAEEFGVSPDQAPDLTRHDRLGVPFTLSS